MSILKWILSGGHSSGHHRSSSSHHGSGHHGSPSSHHGSSHHGYSSDHHGSGHHGSYSSNYNQPTNPYNYQNPVAPISTLSHAVCVNCNHANTQQAKFCQECGQSMLPSKCVQCQGIMPVNSKFCPHCGLSA